MHLRIPIGPPRSQVFYTLFPPEFVASPRTQKFSFDFAGTNRSDLHLGWTNCRPSSRVTFENFVAFTAHVRPGGLAEAGLIRVYLAMLQSGSMR